MAGLVPGVPEAELLERRDARPRERGVSRPLLGLVPLPRGAGDVDVGADMMHDPAIPRLEVHRRDVGLPGQLRGDHEATIDVRSRGGDREVLTGSSTRSGVPNFQSAANRTGGGICSGRPAGHPPRPRLREWRSPSSERDWSCLSFGPTPGAGFHGGMLRSPATSAISAARFRACSYVSRAKGPT